MGTVLKGYKDGGLKNADISSKNASLREIIWLLFSQMKINTTTWHQTKAFGWKFKFHCNLYFIQTLIKKLLPSIKIFLLIAKYTFSSSPESPSCLLSQFLWYSKCIQVGNNHVNHLTKFVSENINFLSQIFKGGNLNSCKGSYI